MIRQTMSEVHPLDESLGNIHECAIALQLMGFTDWAIKLATAHETIQGYLIANEPEPEPDTEAHLGDWTEGDGTPDHRRPA